jgi:protein-tyrosine phosphatase
VRICFVCLGNICRSPAAAAVFTHLAAEEGIEVTVDSAGTSRYHLGEGPHEHTADEAGRRGIAIHHRARQFTAADFDRFDLVVAMDTANRRDLRRLAPDDDARAKVVMLRSFADGDLDVPDPWGLPPIAYAEMYDLLDAACRGLVTHVRTRP